MRAEVRTHGEASGKRKNGNEALLAISFIVGFFARLSANAFGEPMIAIFAADFFS